MTQEHPITPPPPHLLKKFSAQAQDEAKKRNGAGYLKTFATLCIEWAMNSKTTPNDRQIRSSEITPPPELVRQWATANGNVYKDMSVFCQIIANKAARWGYEQRGAVNEAELQKARDEELGACCDAIYEHEGQPLCGGTAEWLRNVRRPKPPSLKELSLKHLEVMERDGHYLPEIISDLRRAIESLPD